MQRAYHQVDIPKDFRFDVGLLCAVRVHRLWIRAIVTDIDGTFCIVQSYDTGTEYRVSVTWSSIFTMFIGIELAHT